MLFCRQHEKGVCLVQVAFLASAHQTAAAFPSLDFSIPTMSSTSPEVPGRGRAVAKSPLIGNYCSNAINVIFVLLRTHGFKHIWWFSVDRTYWPSRCYVVLSLPFGTFSHYLLRRGSLLEDSKYPISSYIIPAPGLKLLIHPRKLVFLSWKMIFYYYNLGICNVSCSSNFLFLGSFTGEGVCVCMCKRACVCICMCVNMCVHVFLCVQMCTCVFVCECTYVCIFDFLHVCVYTCMCGYISVCAWMGVNMWVCVCMYVCVHTCACVCVWHMCICVCMFVCSFMCGCMCKDWIHKCSYQQTQLRVSTRSFYLLTPCHTSIPCHIKGPCPQQLW